MAIEAPMIALLILILILGSRVYYTVPIEKMVMNARTHVCVTAPLVYTRKQRDGDVHLTIAKVVGGVEHKVVVEVIPLLPLPIPRVGQVIKACGISRFDRWHGFVEIHPAESIEVVR